MAVSFIKRLATTVTKGWDDRIKSASLCNILAETLTSTREANPVGENWCMDGKEITVWVDVSSVATGVALEMNETVIEDACSLRPTNDAQHINLAEYDAALKGVKLALQWEATVFPQREYVSCFFSLGLILNTYIYIYIYRKRDCR